MVQLDCCGSPDGIQDLKDTVIKLQNAGLGHTVEWLETEAQIVQRVPRLSDSDIQVRFYLVRYARRELHNVVLFQGVEGYIL